MPPGRQEARPRRLQCYIKEAESKINQLDVQSRAGGFAAKILTYKYVYILCESVKNIFICELVVNNYEYILQHSKVSLFREINRKMKCIKTLDILEG